MKVNENEDICYDETVIMPPNKEYEVVCIKVEKYKKLQAENKALKGKNKRLKRYVEMWNEVYGAADEYHDKHGCLKESMDEIEENYLEELNRKRGKKAKVITPLEKQMTREHSNKQHFGGCYEEEGEDA